MADAPTAGRLLALLSLLQGRREWPGTLLARRLDVSQRTVRRDVERLRGLGYPIDSTSGPAGGYSLTAGAAMPPLLLDDDEAIAVAIALRTAARSAVAGIEETALRALVKLEQVLPVAPAPPRAGLRRDRGRSAARAAARSSTRRRSRCSAPRAATASMLRFGYRGRDGERSRRMVEPHALVAHGRRWYLLAFDPARTGWRTFRVDRVESPGALRLPLRASCDPGGRRGDLPDADALGRRLPPRGTGPLPGAGEAAARPGRAGGSCVSSRTARASTRRATTTSTGSRSGSPRRTSTSSSLAGSARAARAPGGDGAADRGRLQRRSGERGAQAAGLGGKQPLDDRERRARADLVAHVEPVVEQRQRRRDHHVGDVRLRRRR